ncbi:MFS transporter [Comamonas testosteroni]|uniref:MFS transporter n=1 Tax=Comamonas testosteroni TaxID=285 RepID=UPI00389A5CB6
MSNLRLAPLPTPSTTSRENTSYRILTTISGAHLINDMMQSLILAIYPILKSGFHLTFGQIGLVTLTYQLTASILQPLVGSYTDRHPSAYSLPISMALTTLGLLILGFAPSYSMVLLAASAMGFGSAAFHPEASRLCRLASGGRHGLAQSYFQVGGNLGAALGPLLAAAVIAPFGQHSVTWFGGLSIIGIALVTPVSRWYIAKQRSILQSRAGQVLRSPLPRRQVRSAIAILLTLIFSKYFYIASISSFFTFYLIEKFGLSVSDAQFQLFLFLFASAIGTFAGGPIGDRIGRRAVIWTSILGAAPFALLLPYANLFWTTTLAIVIGFVLSSAFSAIVVYGQELVPHKIGAISGLFFGFAFGMGGLGAAVLGLWADYTSIDQVYSMIAFLPLLGMVACYLPDLKGKQN